MKTIDYKKVVKSVWLFWWCYTRRIIDNYIFHLLKFILPNLANLTKLFRHNNSTCSFNRHDYFLKEKLTKPPHKEVRRDKNQVGSELN